MFVGGRIPGPSIFLRIPIGGEPRNAWLRLLKSGEIPFWVVSCSFTLVGWRRNRVLYIFPLLIARQHFGDGIIYREDNVIVSKSVAYPRIKAGSGGGIASTVVKSDVAATRGSKDLPSQVEYISRHVHHRFKIGALFFTPIYHSLESRCLLSSLVPPISIRKLYSHS